MFKKILSEKCLFCLFASENFLPDDQNIHCLGWDGDGVRMSRGAKEKGPGPVLTAQNESCTDRSVLAERRDFHLSVTRPGPWLRGSQEMVRPALRREQDIFVLKAQGGHAHTLRFTCPGILQVNTEKEATLRSQGAGPHLLITPVLLGRHGYGSGPDLLVLFGGGTIGPLTFTHLALESFIIPGGNPRLRGSHPHPALPQAPQRSSASGEFAYSAFPYNGTMPDM